MLIKFGFLNDLILSVISSNSNSYLAYGLGIGVGLNINGLLGGTMLQLNKENDNYELTKTNDSPFSYHLFLLEEIKTAVDNDQICKYHFSFLRNILEKTATFLGYSTWYDLLSPIEGSSKSYVKRILNFSSHSKHSAEEIVTITDNDKIVLKRLVTEINRIYRFKNEELAIVEEES